MLRACLHHFARDRRANVAVITALDDGSDHLPARHDARFHPGAAQEGAVGRGRRRAGDRRRQAGHAEKPGQTRANPCNSEHCGQEPTAQPSLTVDGQLREPRADRLLHQLRPRSRSHDPTTGHSDRRNVQVCVSTLPQQFSQDAPATGVADHGRVRDGASGSCAQHEFLSFCWTTRRRWGSARPRPTSAISSAPPPLRSSQLSSSQNCGFACHETNIAHDGGTKDNLTIARNNNVTLRIDLVTNAVNQLLNTWSRIARRQACRAASCSACRP